LISKDRLRFVGRILIFLSYAVWISFFYQRMMFEKVGISTEGISFGWHLVMFLILFIPGIYFSKFIKHK